MQTVSIPMETTCMKYQILFSGKNKIIFQNVWRKFYPECWELSLKVQITNADILIFFIIIIIIINFSDK